MEVTDNWFLGTFIADVKIEFLPFKHFLTVTTLLWKTWTYLLMFPCYHNVGTIVLAVRTRIRPFGALFGLVVMNE